MSEGTLIFPRATSTFRAFVRTDGSGLARSATSDGIRAALLSARSTLLRLMVGVMIFGQWGQGSWIEHPIREQFHAVVHEEPRHRIAPDE